ncbi:hypothetical protein ACFX1R_014897 [Malus domestica]
MSIQGPSMLDLELGWRFLQGPLRLVLELGFDSRVVNRHVQPTTPSKSTQEFEGQNEFTVLRQMRHLLEFFIADSFC